jgi:alpha-ketoglutarate-dependent taurine dioxygenase
MSTTVDDRTTIKTRAATPKLRGVDIRVWDEANDFILFVEATAPSTCGKIEWFVEHKAEIRAALDRFGAVFFRGFPGDSHAFEATIDALAGDPLSYAGGVSPRSSVHGTVYTATDAPPGLAIVQHHELSYNRYAPRYICFYCDTPPADGGATPLTDGRRFGRTLATAAPEVVGAFEREGVLFVRNYNEANFKGWREAWNTSDRAALETMLREADVEWEWLEPEWLRTRQRLPAIVRDPASGARVLFSCVHLWHRWYVTKMNAATGVPLPDDPAKQPYATFFGDGSAIPEDFVALMHETFAAQSVAIPYRKNDFVLVNNLLVTHGRQSYVPPRKVYVTMREKVLLTSPPFCQPATEKHAHV